MKKINKIIVVAVALTLILSMVAGCGTSKNNSNQTGTQPVGTQPVGTQPVGTQPVGTQSAGTQSAGTQPTGNQQTTTQNPATSDTTQSEQPALTENEPKQGKPVIITVYFSDSQAMYIVPEKRDIILADNENIETRIFNELMEGPKTEGLRAVIPKGTRLLSINVKDGMCTIDLSKEFVDNSPGGTASEAMTLGSVVNTMTELDNIKKVQSLIEGQKREVYTHAIFDEPFTRDEASIKP